MDWPLAIERNRQALLMIVASIVALLGGRDAEGPIARGLRRAVLALLRPAESAARRLIVMTARGLVAPTVAPRPFPAALAGSASSSLDRTPTFPLFDRQKRYGRLLRPEPRGVPRIRSFWGPPLAQSIGLPEPPVSRPDPTAPVDGGVLRLRLAALELALADLPRQARRLARLRARQAGRPHVPRRAPLRIGRPPGWRRTPGRDVDIVLRDCHALAMDALRADTS
jgi:hypothetical protein